MSGESRNHLIDFTVSQAQKIFFDCVIYQQDNHYTTSTAVSVSDIKYLYMHPCLLWEASDVKNSNCFQRSIARYCTQNAYFDIWYCSCRFGYLTDLKLIKFSHKKKKKLAPFDLIDKADYPDNTTFII